MRLRALSLCALASAAWSGCALDDAGPLDPAADVAALAPGPAAAAPVAPRITTPPRHNYEDAPRTPDVDDPAIWRPRSRHQRPLVIGTLKNAGIEVYDLDGRILQTVSAPNRPAIGADDPPAPGVQPEAATSPCPGSASGETFGRLNNVDIVYGVRMRRDGRWRRVDLAVVTDRGCDRLRIFAIEPGRAGGPLVDVTAPDAPRIFPTRRVLASPVQSPGAPAVEVQPNPIDDQDTTYGLAVYQDGGRVRVVVSQEHRNTLAVVELRATRDGRFTYEPRAELRFPAVFDVAGPGGARVAWTPCREEPAEDLQFEGLVVDTDHGVLYASQEIVGVWALDLDELCGVVDVSPDHLVERVKSFGAPFWAVPDDGEYECLAEAPEDVPAGTVAGPGVAGAGGAHLEADVEGMTVYYDRGDATYLIVSSQGSSTFEVYDLAHRRRPLASRNLGRFQIDGVGSTDGITVVGADLGGAFRDGLLVIQNGDAPPPASTEPIAGYEYDGSAQLVYVRWADVAASFSPRLLTPR